MARPYTNKEKFLVEAPRLAILIRRRRLRRSARAIRGWRERYAASGHAIGPMSDVTPFPVADVLAALVERRDLSAAQMRALVGALVAGRCAEADTAGARVAAA